MSELFVVCFLACTFSVVVCGVVAYQVVPLLMRRAITKRVAGGLELGAKGANGFTPSVGEWNKYVWCGCGHREDVPLGQPLDMVLLHRGWQPIQRGWRCPSCSHASTGDTA